MSKTMLEYTNPVSLYNALSSGISEPQQLVALKAIVASGHLDANFDVIVDINSGELRNVKSHIWNDAALVVLKKGKLEEVMEVFSYLPAQRYFEATRMLLLKRLLRGPIKLWLRGDGVSPYTFSYFREEARFLPSETKLMLNKVEASYNHEYVDALSDFRMGLFKEDQWERLQHMAHHFHALKEKREKKKKIAA